MANNDEGWDEWDAEDGSSTVRARARARTPPIAA